MEEKQWGNACTQWRAALGAEYVVTDAGECQRAATATFATTQTIPAILRPADRAQVQACMRIASEHGVAVYPTSRGCNWGLGSRVPVAERCALLDLGRLRQIVRFSQTMATITIEPGVTFEQVVQFLDDNDTGLFFNITGSSPWSSPLANALERGDGIGPYGDRAAHVCGLEVVMPDGRVVHTGMSRFDGAATADLFHWGVGPSLDGLFAQSNLGVVTKMTCWLKPKPAVLQIVRFSIGTQEQLGPLVDAIRMLRAEGTLRSGLGMWDCTRAFSARGRFPFETEKPPLTRERVGELHEGLDLFFGVTAIYSAHRTQALGNVERVREVLAPLTNTLAVAVQYAGSSEIEDTVVKGTSSDLAPFGDVATAFRLMQGQPSVASQGSMYWRKRDATDGFQTPEQDNCGVIWACPLVPLEGTQVMAANQLVEEIVVRHGFEPLFSWVVQHDRVAYLIALIIYDRDVEGEDARARACHDEVMARCLDRGWIPWRLGIQSMGALPRGLDDTDAVVRQIKEVLDPKGVLAPGRYISESS